MKKENNGRTKTQVTLQRRDMQKVAKLCSECTQRCKQPEYCKVHKCPNFVGIKPPEK